MFEHGTSAAASEFCEWVEVGTDLYIFHRNYQVKAHSFPWFSAAGATAVAYRTTSFLYTNVFINLLCLRLTAKENDHLCKRVVKSVKLAFANKTKESISC